MNNEYEIKKRISRLSSRLYGDIRAICDKDGLTQDSLEDLIRSVTFDRVRLALSLYKSAKTLDFQSNKQDGDYRSIISRCYYCHFHLA